MPLFLSVSLILDEHIDVCYIYTCIFASAELTNADPLRACSRPFTSHSNSYFEVESHPARRAPGMLPNSPHCPTVIRY